MTNPETAPLTPEILVPRLGENLVEQGLLSEDNLQRALAHQNEIRSTRGFAPPLGELMVEMGLIDRATLEEAITRQILQLRMALQDANAQLEARVQQRTLELEQALKRLSELNHLKSNFVANISHELRTPLTHVKGYLDLFNNHDLGPVTEEQEHALTVMLRATDRLEKLIEDLILLSMTEREPVTLHVQPFNLTNLLRASITRVIQKTKENNQRLDPDFPASGLLVEGDEEKIGWVIMQLLDNAIKFTPPGGTITLHAGPEGDYISIAVQDTGIGIPENRLEEIFEPFHQLDGSSTRRFGGTGLGLTLVKKIVEAHGSIIAVTSQESRGSNFEFLLKKASLTAISYPVDQV